MWTAENRARYNRSHLRYPSDLTDEEWGLVRPEIPRVKRGGNKRTVDMREVLNGLMYVLSTGCQWRAIPKDLPPRRLSDRIHFEGHVTPTGVVWRHQSKVDFPCNRLQPHVSVSHRVPARHVPSPRRGLPPPSFAIAPRGPSNHFREDAV